ncbi:MAG: glycosyltransferase family 4 protein [Sedimentisphaerales bacterium]|nr:glycosyltransferase family 4 protein [Sedimentisphaerales bacterium]
MIKADFGHNDKPRICFVAHNAYGALAGKDTGHIGGIERQQSLMAKWLAKRGYKVSMITWDEGQEDNQVINGIRTLQMCTFNAGIKGLRFLYPKWTSLCRAMRRANADIYYYNCGDLGLGQVVMWCHRHGRKCVYSVASNPDCDPKLPVLKPLRERILYKYGLKHVDSVIVQTQHQQQMLREGFGINSTVIPMPCEGSSKNEKIRLEKAKEESVHVLWVGRISKEKRFEWLLDVAVQCPQIIFDIVGAANTDSDYTSSLIKRASGIRNVKMHGRISHQEMSKYYSSSNILCCTSAYEGFPNTFLEAWSVGIPVVSTFNPDDVIQKKGLGFVANDVEEIVSRLMEITQSPETWQRASKAAKQYYQEHHAIDVSLPRFERLFLDVAGYQS